MTTLLLRLDGPMQAWGTSSRHSTRDTNTHPSKSGVVGLVAAALGRTYEDSIDDLAAVRFAVRIDQPGTIMRDFHTAAGGGLGNASISNRYYLHDAVFVAALEGPDQLITVIADALNAPRFPLFLGRKACLPAAPIRMGTTPQALLEALRTAPWQASTTVKTAAHKAGADVTVDIFHDTTEPDSPSVHFTTDHPVSFNPNHRSYTLRPVGHTTHTVYTGSTRAHDPMEGF